MGRSCQVGHDLLTDRDLSLVRMNGKRSSNASNRPPAFRFLDTADARRIRPPVGHGQLQRERIVEPQRSRPVAATLRRSAGARLGKPPLDPPPWPPGEPTPVADPRYPPGTPGRAPHSRRSSRCVASQPGRGRRAEAEADAATRCAQRAITAPCSSRMTSLDARAAPPVEPCHFAREDALAPRPSWPFQ